MQQHFATANTAASAPLQPQQLRAAAPCSRSLRGFRGRKVLQPLQPHHPAVATFADAALCSCSCSALKQRPTQPQCPIVVGYFARIIYTQLPCGLHYPRAVGDLRKQILSSRMEIQKTPLDLVIQFTSHAKLLFESTTLEFLEEVGLAQLSMQMSTMDAS